MNLLIIFILTIHLWISKNCANGIEIRENRTLIDFPKVMHNFFYKNDLMNGSENILNKNSYLDYKNIYKLRFNPNENDFVKSTKLSEVIENVVTAACEDEILEQVTTELPVNNKIEKNIMKPNSLNFLTPQIKSFLNFNNSEGLPNGSKRFLNLFNIIKFQNGPCFSTNILFGQMNGTCFHKMECDQLGGLSLNSCANGFGVCCVCKIVTNQFFDFCVFSLIFFFNLKISST